jgi:hypothetical protein
MHSRVPHAAPRGEDVAVDAVVDEFADMAHLCPKNFPV